MKDAFPGDFDRTSTRWKLEKGQPLWGWLGVIDFLSQLRQDTSPTELLDVGLPHLNTAQIPSKTSYNCKKTGQYSDWHL